MTDVGYNQAIAAIAAAGLSMEDAANALTALFGNPDVQKAFAPVDMLHHVVYRQLLDGTPIVDAESFEFRRNGKWYRADGTPIDEKE